uniref:Kinesin motor domain-containing protein n=1 Tax=Oryza meridionalis TaxID=40149 RepID=A0A0E0CRD1_9ORYZ
MEGSEAAQQKDSVKVAVNIRPLITPELLLGCTDCVTVTPGEPQVQIGPHVFTYDHVFGSTGSPSSLIFEQCVHPLIDSLFRGYNATVLAYGQTGSGKTYTMGTNYTGEANCGGIIPQVMETIFKKADALKDGTEFLIRVSFIEIFKEEVFDLLDASHAALRLDSGSVAKATAPARVPIQIRETGNGGITLAGVTEAEVKTKEEMASFLARGSSSRATGSTNMNSQSSRSHAIFTISMDQKKTSSASDKLSNDDYDILSSKFHLVDLAGSERAKRTGADGLRLKEGIHINRGLLALGNVISALGDEKKRKEGAFVPYRDSKLTRLLQDSLGGNSKTAMIACISPADSNAEETINTLKYANRARNIQNKAVINRDPVTAEMQKLRSQLEQLQTELLFSRSGSAALEELQLLQQKVSLLELKNSELNHELKERELSYEQLAQSALAAQLEKDQLMLKIESARNGKSWDDIENTDTDQDVEVMKRYILKIQQLESELTRQKFSSTCKNDLHDRFAMDKDLLLDDLGSGCEVGTPDASSAVNFRITPVPAGEADEEKERDHSSMQDKLDKELQELDKRLQQKEAEMKEFAKSDTSVLKQHYEKKLNEMEQEKKALQKEIEELRHALTNITSCTDESAQKLKDNYLQKLNTLESQVSELKKKQEAQQQLIRQKQRSDEAAKRLQEDIHRIKSQKVQLQQKIKQESEQFRSWKAAREKEVLQLKKEGRRNEYEMHKLLALNQRQKMVLQRKTEEAAMATKRLKESLEAKKSTRDTYGSASGSGVQALMRAIDDELEVTVRAYELRSHYERQMQERSAISKEIAKLKECPQAMSPSARSSRISALENMLSSSSSAMVSMASQLSEAEERERAFNGKGRWNHVRSLPDAKNTMNYLFQLASSSRCQQLDKEVMCKEKEHLICDLKEKVVALNGRIRQLETQVKDLNNQNMLLFTAISEAKIPVGTSRKGTVGSEDGQHYAMRKSIRASHNLHYSKNSFLWSDDMDISDSEKSEGSDADWEASDADYGASDADWECSKKVRRRRQTVSSHLNPNPGSGTTQKSAKSVMASQEKSTSLDFAPQCCSCSKYSSCKTQKCECRASGSHCGGDCGCITSRCSNRVDMKEEKEGGGVVEVSSSDDVDDAKVQEIVKEGVMLLENSMSEKEAQETKSRKPLADIGNGVVKQTGAKPKQRKNWRKSTVQLVPSAPPLPPTAPQNTEPVPRNRDIPLRLPRAMSSPAVDSIPLTDRNAAKPDESMSSNKENVTAVRARSPARPRKNANEKENHLR